MENNINEQTKEQPAINPGNGLQPQATSIIEQARIEREKLEQAIARNEEILKRNEEVLAKQILGGRTEAGTAPIPVKEETPREYAKRLINGS